MDFSHLFVGGRTVGDNNDRDVAHARVGAQLLQDLKTGHTGHHPVKQYQRSGLFSQPFQSKFAALEWPNPPGHFEAWCEARTGYPIVDAAMRQLNQTGYMHNRLRMIVASFLVKDLQVDWRLGEGYFAQKLVDFDLAANIGGWQWSAGVGTDAQPWFRIFNPVTQSENFDPQGKFIHRYLPELAAVPEKFIHAPWRYPAGTPGYPSPIVDHAQARAITLALFRSVGASSDAKPPAN